MSLLLIFIDIHWAKIDGPVRFGVPQIASIFTAAYENGQFTRNKKGPSPPFGI